MTSRFEELLPAYRATRYCALLPFGEVDIRIGDHTPALDTHLASQGLDSWAFVSAFNPDSRELPEDENLRRHAQLRKTVAAKGYPFFEGQGIPLNPGWSPEDSLLVLGIDRTDALWLGHGFGQLAIVLGKAGAAAEVLECPQKQED